MKIVDKHGMEWPLSDDELRLILNCIVNRSVEEFDSWDDDMADVLHERLSAIYAIGGMS